ncbi:MAG: type VI secretion system-associated protein TagF [Rhizobacter sp.]
MSQQPVTSVMPTPRAAWFGKLPGLGDFVGRRMPHAFGSDWDHWLRSGLEQLRNEAPEVWEQRFVQSPLWFFVAPALATGKPTCGVVAPSIDRVGRYYPITILAMADEEDGRFASDSDLALFFAAARAAVIDARRLPLSAEGMDGRLTELVWPFVEKAEPSNKNSLISDLLADLNAASASATQSAAVTLPSLPWRDLVAQGSETSVWWVSPTAQGPYQEVVHHGAFHRSLFSRLFQGAGR